MRLRNMYLLFGYLARMKNKGLNQNKTMFFLIIKTFKH